MGKFEGMDLEESRQYQLKQWVEGNPLHNPVTNECCPDFSCCTKSKKMMSLEERERFVEAYEDGNESEMTSILAMGLVMALGIDEN